jgi:hypothetical protein
VQLMGSGRPTAEQQRNPIEATGSKVEAVRVWLLGSFRISVGPSLSIGRDEWHLKKAANLVKLLALARDHHLHREQASGLLWPELDERAAANNLHHALYVARRTLEPSSPAGAAASSYLRLRYERVALCPDGPLWVDVDAFEEAAITARHAREVAAFRAALDLYTGELLSQDRYEGWVEQRRARARYRLSGFELTEGNAEAVGRICRRLEGIPLAIELAAPRMGALSVEQIAQRLDESLRLLTGGGRTVEPRHQTLRATLDWSQDLLSEQERVLFGGLSVFAGGWTLEAAEEVCSDEGIERDEVLDLLSRLVEKSLVVAEQGDAMRYRMLEPVRQYGHERLLENGEAERVR